MTKQMNKICLVLTSLLIIIVSIYIFTVENNNLLKGEKADIPTSPAAQSETIETAVSPAESATAELQEGATAPAPKADTPLSVKADPTPAEPSTPTEASSKPSAPTGNEETTIKTATPKAVPTTDFVTMEQQIVALVNDERAAIGLAELKVNDSLAGVAETKAEDLRDQNYFAHQSPTYGSPFDMMKQFSISFSTAGENLAKGQKTPEEVMNDWMESSGHKANILNSAYTEIGVGYVTNNDGTTYWVQQFIRP